MTGTTATSVSAKGKRWREAFPVNAAIFDLAAKHGLSVAQLAAKMQASEETIYSWRRTKPMRAPKMALALLCRELSEPLHPQLRLKSQQRD